MRGILAEGRPRTDWHPAPRARRRRAILALAVAVLSLAATFGQAAAQTSVKLVGNTEGSQVGGQPLYNDNAQAFTTGSHGLGYRLTGVDVHLYSTGQAEPDYSVTIQTDVSGNPGATVGTLTHPASVTLGALNRYTASGGIDLAANTKYWLVFDVEPGTPSPEWHLGGAAPGSTLDPGAAAGWSLADIRFRGRGTAAWRTLGSHGLLVAIHGYAKTPPPPERPGRPSPPVVTTASETSLTVSWSPPSGGAAVTDYDLRYYAGTADPSNPADWIEEGEPNGPPDPGTATTATITGLSPGTSYRVQVRAASGGREGPWSASFAAGTVALPSVSVESGSATEGSPVTFTARLSRAVGSDVVLGWSTGIDDDRRARAATAGTDYKEVTHGRVTIPAGETAATFSVVTLADREAEGEETFKVMIAGIRLPDEVTIAGASAVGTIEDDWPPPDPTVSVEGGTATEGTPVTFTARLSLTASSDVVLGWSTEPDDSPGARAATAGTDYREVTNGRVRIAAGETEATFSVGTLPDFEFEEEGYETFKVTVVGIGLPDGVTIAVPSAVGTIEDDLPPPLRDSVSVEGGSAEEGTPVTFTARLSSAVNSDVVLRWFTTPDWTRGARRATAGTDYTAVRDGQVRIPAGATAATFAVATVRDTVEEGDETFRVNITHLELPFGVGIVTWAATGKIEDYTPPPNEAPAFDPSEYAFELRENLNGSAEPVALGTVSAADPDGDTLSYELASGGAARFAVGEADGAVSYVGPGEDFEAEPNVYELTVRASDPDGLSAEALVTVTVVNVNELPEAADDEASTDEDVAVTVDVLANDTDPDGDSLRVASVSAPANGTAEVAAGGGVLYTPAANWRGTDSFTYEVDDGNGGTASASVEVTVAPVNDLPEAAGDTASTVEDSAVVVDVLANDTDIDGDSLRVASVSAPENGTAAVAAGGVLYTPAPNWHGTDSFTYEVGDGNGGTASATVEVTVAPVNDVPEAADDEAATDEDEAVAVDVLANDTDPDGDSLRVSSVSAPANGMAEVAAGGVRYTPAANWHGTDSFTYEIDDGNGGTASASVEVMVVPVNDVPEAVGDSASTVEDEAVEVDVLANDTDIDGDGLRVAAVSAPENGSAAITAGGVLYTPAANWHGTDSFTYEVDDGNGGTASASVEVTVAPVNDAPEAVDDEASTNEDEAVTVDVLANDTDPDGDGLRVAAVSAPENGSAEVSAGVVLYMPAANWHGTDRFTYVADDGNGGASEAAVEVTVAPVNDAPAVVGTIPAQSLEEGGEAARIELGPFFEDGDGDVLEYSASSSDPSVAEASVAGAVLTLVPAGYGTATVTVTAADAGGLTAMQTVSVGVTDRAARDVVSHTLAGLARSHLASARMTLGRRAAASRSGASRLTLLGRDVPLDKASARSTAEQMWSGWLSGVSSRAMSHAGATPGLTASGGTDAGTGLGMPGTGGSGGDASLGDLFRAGDLVRFTGGRDPLHGSEFQFALGGAQNAGGGGGLRLQLWGQGDVQTFQGAPSDASDYDGELQTGYVGVDTWLSDTWMLGVAVARSRGTGDWRAGATGGSLETRLMAVHPYLQWSSGATSVWAMGGAGWGDADNVRDRGGRTETSGLGLRMGLVDLRRRLAASGGFEFALRADAGWAELATDDGTETLDGQTAAVNQMRFGVELSQQLRLGGLTLAPFGEAHLRRDGGDGQPGTGLELIGGLRAQAGFLRIDAQGRMLAVHSATGYEERGFGATLSLGSRGGEGPSLSLSPRWGDAIAGGDALWQEQIYSRHTPAAADGQTAPNARDGWALDLSGGYGIRIPGDRLLTWSTSVNHSPAGPRFMLGAQLGFGGASGSEPSADGVMVP